MLNDKVILVTGGTGFFGKKFVETVFKKYKPKKIIVYSRDEFKQSEMRKTFSEGKYQIRYFIGDIRDKDRMFHAFKGVDYVIHAAALKQVPALEYNPTEAVKTNVVGADNIVDVAINAGVEKVISLSTDKAVSPINLYGASKLVAEKIFVAANAYSGKSVKFASVRYGNVVGSRGSVIPLFLQLKEQGIKEFPITDERMTRFWLTLNQAIAWVIKALEESVGGEVFIPKLPSMKITDLAKAIDPDCTFRKIGIRPGEKLHETLISEEEVPQVKVMKNCYVILSFFYDSKEVHKKYSSLPNLEEGFSYRSNKNKIWLNSEQLRKMIGL